MRRWQDAALPEKGRGRSAPYHAFTCMPELVASTVSTGSAKDGTIRALLTFDEHVSRQIITRLSIR